jgi:phosphoglycolate phosphatase
MDLSSAVGPPLVKTFGQLLPDPRLIAPALEAYRSIYLEEVKRSAVPMPGALGALDAMFREGVALAVATYKLSGVAEIVLQAAGIRPYFAAVVGWTDDADGRDKAALVTHALELVRPHRSAPVYVGDLDADEEAAKRAGIAFLRVGPLSWDDILGAVIPDSSHPQ